MKTWKRVLAFALTGTMMVGCLTGCASERTVKFEETKQNMKPTIAETDIDFIKGGASDYVIVCPAEPTANETVAAEELQYFIKEATGAELTIINESDDLADGKYINVGATKAADSVGVKPTYNDVKYNGFILKLIDDDLYLRGYSDIGTKNAVYEFLYYAFDYELYAADEIYLTETKDAKMLAYDLTVLPDFDWREANYGEIIHNETLRNRMRMNATEEILVTGHLTHNTMTIIDPNVYNWKSEEYKDWFSEATWTGFNNSQGVEKPSQLCFSNDEMRAEFTKNLIELIKDSSAPNMLLGIEDNYDWCTCDACQASHDKYGTDAAVTIQFVNKVQAEVNAWFSENRPNDNPTSLVIFAYHTTVNPPAKYNEETKKWEPMDESVVLNENSGVMFAPIGASIDVPFSEAEITDVADAYGQLLGWASLSKNLYAWIYSLFPYQGLMFCNTVEVMQQNYDLLLENGATMILDQTEHYQRKVGTGFSRLKAYLMSKLQWDNSLNMNELINDFFAHYFGEAADTMQGLFDQQREWYAHLYADLEAGSTIQDDLLNENYWSYNQLQGYLKLIDQAYKDIAPLREGNPERYEQLYQRILLESMQYRYMILSLYGTEYSEAELLNERNKFRFDFEQLGLTRHEESFEVSELWIKWGIN